MLRNTFRRLVGFLILIVFGIAIFQFTRQTTGNEHLQAALSSGLWLLLFLAGVIGLAWWADRRTKRSGQ